MVRYLMGGSCMGSIRTYKVVALLSFNFTFLVVDHRYYVKGCVEFYPVRPLLFKVLCNDLVVEISPIRELDWWMSYMYKE